MWNKSTGYNKNERGQMLVLLMLVVVGLFGFAALAIDTGTVYAERRNAQSAADAAAMAAAYASVKGGNYVSAALSLANENEYDNDGVTNTVTVHNPPISGDFAGDSKYYQVFITVTSQPALSHYIFSGSLTNTVEAVVRAIPSSELYLGNALTATNDTACQALWFHGNNTVNVTGTIFSNSSAWTEICMAGVQEGAAGEIHVTSGSISTVGGWNNHKIADVTADGGIIEGVAPLPEPDLLIPDCTGLPSLVHGGGNAVLEPGVYSGGIVIDGGSTVTLNPGMYCIENGLIALNGTLTGNEVFLYIKTGDFDIGGNVFVNLSAPIYLADYSGQLWSGMLVYMDPSNTGVANLRGTSGSSYTGTIYAFDQHCLLEGTSDNISINCSVICDTIEVAGASDLAINYDESQNYEKSPVLELSK